MNVANETSVHRLYREGHPIGLSQRIAKLIEPGFVPGHIVAQYLQQALNIPRVCHYYFERKLMCQPFQLTIIQLYPHLLTCVLIAYGYRHSG